MTRGGKNSDGYPSLPEIDPAVDSASGVAGWARAKLAAVDPEGLDGEVGPPAAVGEQAVARANPRMTSASDLIDLRNLNADSSAELRRLNAPASIAVLGKNQSVTFGRPGIG